MKSYGGSESQAEVYIKLVEERNENHQCTPKQQAGQWWDDESQKDSRNNELT